jgi:transcriptional regulator with XRE-family HTH domain
MSRRLQRKIAAIDIAELIGISKSYYADIEKGRRSPPNRKALDKIVQRLDLTDEEKVVFFDLAGINNPRFDISPDLIDYIMGNEIVRIFLRIAREKADDEDWREFIEKLRNK